MRRLPLSAESTAAHFGGRKKSAFELKFSFFFFLFDFFSRLHRFFPDQRRLFTRQAFHGRARKREANQKSYECLGDEKDDEKKTGT
jgi:hypothetical protein